MLLNRIVIKRFPSGEYYINISYGGWTISLVTFIFWVIFCSSMHLFLTLLLIINNANSEYAVIATHMFLTCLQTETLSKLIDTTLATQLPGVTDSKQTSLL